MSRNLSEPTYTATQMRNVHIFSDDGEDIGGLSVEISTSLCRLKYIVLHVSYRMAD